MVRSREASAYCVPEIVVLFVVQDVVNAIGGEHFSCVGGAGAFATAAERVLESVCDLVVAE